MLRCPNAQECAPSISLAAQVGHSHKITGCLSFNVYADDAAVAAKVAALRAPLAALNAQIVGELEREGRGPRGGGGGSG